MYGVSSSNCTDYGARLRVRLINTLGLIKVDSQTPRKNQGELLYQPYPDSPESKCRSLHGAVPLSPCCKPVELLTLQRSFDFESHQLWAASRSLIISRICLPRQCQNCDAIIILARFQCGRLDQQHLKKRSLGNWNIGW